MASRSITRSGRRALFSAPEAATGPGRERGFLPTPDPLQVLPSAFAAWDEVGRELPKLLAAGRARTVLERLPPLNPDDLPEAAVRRAMVLLSFFGHAYVHETWRTAPARNLPSVLARPWAQVARRLGRPPVLSYASYALDNWRRLDPHGPVAVGNLALLQNFLGGLDEEWFVTIHVQIEAEAATALAALPRAQQAAIAGDQPGLRAALTEVAATTARMHQTLLRMPENCDPYIYYHRVRPFIHGWHLSPVVYDGVPEYGGVAQAFYGETGAQSTIVPCLDAVLGVPHQPDELRVYLRGMRTYMPPSDVAFLEQLEAGPAVREYVVEHTADAELRNVYDACVTALEAFRSTHLEYAARYIQNQAQVGANSTAYGTGGTPFMRYLKKHRDETGQSRLGTARS